MVQKIIVGLQQKIGQPNFGSMGASCSIELSLDGDEAMRPEQVATQVRQAFAQCRETISRELATHRDRLPNEPSERPKKKPSQPDAAFSPNARASNGKAARMASEAQVASHTHDCFESRAVAHKRVGAGLRRALSRSAYGVSQASQLIVH